jgi:DNA-binding response OmpR family regulator
MKKPCKVLLVEDDEDDYILTRNLFAEAKESEFKLEWVQTYAEALEAVQKGDPDVILLDYSLGVLSGLDLITELTSQGCRAPIIILTGRGSYSVDLRAMQAGASDYLVKGEVTAHLLERTIRYAIERKQT